ncbi:MAG: hypothetical protein Ct9H300mP14_02540 [Gammaproteobacteria bacterium]|nr:MAG: hypothetical protein Ct9H300mP14_02540 [Gammaproteobacteria bacterium]
MNLSPIATAAVFSCAVHVGALAVFAHTNRPPELLRKSSFPQPQATLIQETQDAGETIEPSAVIELLKQTDGQTLIEKTRHNHHGRSGKRSTQNCH